MVCYDVAGARNVTEIRGELRNKRKMARLAWRAVHRAADGNNQGLVVSPGHKFATLEVVAEVMDGKIES